MGNRSECNGIWVDRLKAVMKKRILKPCLMQESDISARVRQSRSSDPFSLQSKQPFGPEPLGLEPFGHELRVE